jgi:hypothetical protein
MAKAKRMADGSRKVKVRKIGFRAPRKVKVVPHFPIGVESDGTVTLPESPSTLDVPLTQVESRDAEGFDCEDPTICE